MRSLVDVHPPTISYGVVGCSMYENESSIICCTAMDDENFNDMGIVDKSILFIQKMLPFKKGALNVFKTSDIEGAQFKLSKEIIDGEYIGRTLMVVNQYE